MAKAQEFNECEKYYLLNSPDSDEKKAKNLGRKANTVRQFIEKNTKVQEPPATPTPPAPAMPSAEQLMGKRKIGDSAVTVMTEAASMAFDEARPDLKKSDKLTRNVYKIK